MTFWLAIFINSVLFLIISIISGYWSCYSIKRIYSLRGTREEKGVVRDRKPGPSQKPARAGPGFGPEYAGPDQASGLG